MATIRHHVLIDAQVAKVYQAISTAEGISTWWDKQTLTQTDRGVVLEHNPGPEHGVVKLRVVELVPNKRVEWECISTHPKGSLGFRLTGTHFIFEITERNNIPSSGSNPNQIRATTLDFCQDGYDERSEFLNSTKSAWGEVLQNLKQVVRIADQLASGWCGFACGEKQNLIRVEAAHIDNIARAMNSRANQDRGGIADHRQPHRIAARGSSTNFLVHATDQPRIIGPHISRRIAALGAHFAANRRRNLRR